jgi:hypothetical protein
MVNARLTDLRPTLVIGLGGTGHEVLVHLKAKLFESYGEDISQVVKFLCFDTGEVPRRVATRRNEVISLNMNRELMSIGRVPVAAILQNISYHPTIGSWLPKDLPIRPGLRPLGRLAFFFHFNMVKDRIRSAIEQVMNIRVLQMIGKNWAVEDTVNVFIVCSLAGGTGSGTFIDTAYLTRYLWNQFNIPNVHINGLLVLPEAYSSLSTTIEQSRRHSANTYAALRELDSFMTGKSYNAEFMRGSPVVVEGSAPFDLCYLVDTINENDHRTDAVKEFMPRLATIIYLHILSQRGEEHRSRLDDIEVLGTDDGTGSYRHYSGVGLAYAPAPQDLRQGVEVLATLRRASAPLWQYNSNILPDGGRGMAVIGVVGVEDKDSSIFGDYILANEDLVSTYDPHTVYCCQTRHGLPLYALTQYIVCRAVHEALMKRHEAYPMHVFNHIDMAAN